MKINLELAVGIPMLGDWIKQNTEGSKTIVEFGAMYFDKLDHTSPEAERIGIEIWRPYIDSSWNKASSSIKRIQGDFLKFEELIEEKEMDCAMFIDTLEHISKEQATDLINKVKQKFNKIILFIPKGNHPQTEDVPGHGAHEYQTHRSSWMEKDLEELGFTDIVAHETFHASEGPKKNHAAMFAIWERD